jgi:preprotein translocase subunit SecA
MIETLIKKIFGDPSEKRLKLYQKELLQIRALEEDIIAKYDSVASIQARVAELRT